MRTPQKAVSEQEGRALVALARSRDIDDRQQLLLSIVALCEVAPPENGVTPVLSEIFLTLARQAERDVRKILSQRLSQVDWAPPALINMLALDEIEIAGPVIAASPLLQDGDLIRVLIEATLEHQIAVARRPYLSGAVADAIIDRGDAVTMTALASNRTALIKEASMGRLVDQSRRIAGLRAPLSRHPRLSEAQAQQLYQWVGQALRQSIGERFRIDDTLLNTTIQQAADDASRTGGAAGWRAMPPPDRRTDQDDRPEMERRLVEKLKTSGQLRPGLLVRALREERLHLFEEALAALGDFPVATVRAAVHAPTAQALYLACIAVGVDRAVFTSLLTEVRKLSGGLPAEARWNAEAMHPQAAARAFRQMMQTPSNV
nr:DUF2336 domain-containing protein [uncultured Brevundimonas sp.]